MRDLKHLIYFENLLQEANNDLVKQAKSDGKLALGYTCYFMPEVLLDLPGCFSVRLRAPRCTSPDMATYYMSSRTCHYGRSLLERALEGGFNFLDAQLATETCTVTCRFQEHLQRMDIIQNERFKCEFMDVPFKKTENSIDHYEAQIKAHVLDFLHDNYGVDTSDEALRQTIESHNELCRIMQAIGDYRKLDVPTITGYEYHVINLVTLACPKYLIIDKLRETLEELKTREPDARLQYRCKVLLAGSEHDDDQRGYPAPPFQQFKTPRQPDNQQQGKGNTADGALPAAVCAQQGTYGHGRRKGQHSHQRQPCVGINGK
ncbi:MAG: 2-hydroxyacyl-CoA dehydratase, partial [Clostridiales bacterium]|nr:2-hydroxyacyl-CoA dehydratase [Clostridiales bacterium]